ncbi:hypothetical protein [Fodinibius sp. SL11]|uniref:hypothetical protein n=1 Tax=Fodinibius sp. SL11 TaxID=3425690 RepID=UPI003F882648
MNNTIKHFFFFALIFAVGSTIFQQNVVQLGNVGSSHSGSDTLCQQLSNGSISNPSGDVDPLFEHDSKSNADDAPLKTITSCNSLMNILPAQSNFSFNPGGKEVTIGIYKPTFSSQAFVFQEPDPPRLG